MIEKPERSTYTAHDFSAFREAGSLELAPPFQRRAVWKTPARAFFIDTLIRGLPVPPIYLRVTQNRERTRTVREVVDGQQRLRALLGFLDGDYALSGALDPAWAGREFAELDPEHQNAVQTYPLLCEVLHGISDAQVLEIFSRLNTYSVQLNAQELRNGTYFGYFKQCAYSLAHEHVGFWRSNRVITENGISRMQEVELTSELMILLLAGLQDKKRSINTFYADYDEEFSSRKVVEERFRSVIDEISEALGSTLMRSHFRRAPLFYSLFGAVAHQRFGVRGFDFPTERGRLGRGARKALRTAVSHLSDIVELARQDEAIPKRYVRFVNASLRQTDNIQPRRIRLEEISRAAFS